MPSYRGELGLPNKHAIAATHQGTDSNAALPRRGRGAANAEACAAMASRPHRAAPAASTTLRCSEAAPVQMTWMTVGRGVAGAGSSSVEAPPHHANISPGLETALFYGLIMTRRAARLGLHRARNVRA